jgi:hypothetical protein
MPEAIFTGWYCAEQRSAPGYVVHGDEANRGLALRPLWWRSVSSFLEPKTVVIVDSASPLVAPDERYFSGRIERIRLQVNPGHAQVTTFHYCGWMASVLLGVEYALLNGMDYFLYVEQDALLFGKELSNRIEDQLRRYRFVFGAGTGTPWPLQQSVFAIRKDGYRKFLAGIHALDQDDKALSPELKFALAATESRAVVTAAKGALWSLPESVKIRALRHGLRPLRDYGVLPFGYGRTRPMRFDDDCFYFQHGSREELQSYAAKLGVQAAGFQLIEPSAREAGVW